MLDTETVNELSRSMQDSIVREQKEKREKKFAMNAIDTVVGVMGAAAIYQERSAPPNRILLFNEWDEEIRGQFPVSPDTYTLSVKETTGGTHYILRRLHGPRDTARDSFAIEFTVEEKNIPRTLDQLMDLIKIKRGFQIGTTYTLSSVPMEPSEEIETAAEIARIFFHHVDQHTLKHRPSLPRLSPS